MWEGGPGQGSLWVQKGGRKSNLSLRPRGHPRCCLLLGPLWGSCPCPWRPAQPREDWWKGEGSGSIPSSKVGTSDLGKLLLGPSVSRHAAESRREHCVRSIASFPPRTCRQPPVSLSHPHKTLTSWLDQTTPRAGPWGRDRLGPISGGRHRCRWGREDGPVHRPPSTSLLDAYFPVGRAEHRSPSQEV